MSADIADEHNLNEGLDTHLGMRFDQLTPDRVVLRWTVTPQLLQPYGLVHGGVHCAAVESAASIGAALWFGDRGTGVGVSNHTDFLRAVRAAGRPPGGAP